jgi:hypothetical protein
MNNKIFLSTKQMASIAIICLWVGIGSDVLGIITSFIENIFVGTEIQDEGIGIMILGLTEIGNFAVSIISYICTIIFFLMWLNRSYKNLSAFNVQGLMTTSGWAVGYWFMPIMSLFKPLQVVNEVWHGSDFENSDKGYGFSDTSTPTLHGFWWATWILSGVLGQISFRMTMQGSDEISGVGSHIAEASELFSIIAGFLLITIVTQITERQEIFGGKLSFLNPPQPPNFN